MRNINKIQQSQRRHEEAKKNKRKELKLPRKKAEQKQFLRKLFAYKIKSEQPGLLVARRSNETDVHIKNKNELNALIDLATLSGYDVIR